MVYSHDGLTQACHSTSFSESLSHRGSLFYISGFGEQSGKYSVDFFLVLAGGCFACCLLKYKLEEKRDEISVLHFF